MLSSVDASIVLSDIYDKVYGIHDHGTTSKTRPMSSVAYHPIEDVESILDSSYEVREYRDLDIGNRFKLTLNEYLNNTTFENNILRKIAKEEAKSEETKSKELTDLQNDLEAYRKRKT